MRTASLGGGAAALSALDPFGAWGGVITVSVTDDANSGLAPGAAFAAPFRLRITTAPVPGSLLSSSSAPPLTLLPNGSALPATPDSADAVLAAALAAGGYWPFGRPDRTVSLSVQSRGAAGPAGPVLFPSLPPDSAVPEGGQTAVKVSLSQAPEPGTAVTLALAAGVFAPGRGVVWGSAALPPAAIGSVVLVSPGISNATQVRGGGGACAAALAEHALHLLRAGRARALPADAHLRCLKLVHACRRPHRIDGGLPRAAARRGRRARARPTGAFALGATP